MHKAEPPWKHLCNSTTVQIACILMSSFTFRSEPNTHSTPTKFCKMPKHMQELERAVMDMCGRSCSVASSHQREIESYRESQRPPLGWRTFRLQNPLKWTVLCCAIIVIASGYSHINAQSEFLELRHNTRENESIFL